MSRKVRIVLACTIVFVTLPAMADMSDPIPTTLTHYEHSVGGLTVITDLDPDFPCS